MYYPEFNFFKMFREKKLTFSPEQWIVSCTCQFRSIFAADPTVLISGSPTSNMALPARWRLFVGLAVIFLFNCINAQNPFRSFQYKYSFKPPYLAQKDGSVPFWGYTGSKRSILVTCGVFLLLIFNIFLFKII